MSQQFFLILAVMAMSVLSACGNTSVKNYGGVRGNGYFQGGGMGGAPMTP